ncbi:hypothetical protein V7S43_017049 [Phytophthora oleae]|uniref:Uncharacterized protein n=1 Tax=Phytophthora oleae TaxID=2107226 RepID=A0ABD3EUZ3_9STRA
MTLWLQCLLIVVSVQFYAVRCNAASSTDLTLSACNYSSEDLYVANSSDTQAPFRTGYVQCANATGTDVTLCELCTCREKKIESVEGVVVAWVVCVGSGDPTTCSSVDGSGHEFCTGTNSSCSGSCDGVDVNVGDSSSSTSSEIAITNGSDASADISSTSSSSDTSVDVGSSSSFDTITSSVGSNSDAPTPSATEAVSLTLLPDGSESQAMNEDNVITGDLGTVEPSQPPADSTEQNIIRPSDSGSTHQLDTNNGRSTSSAWSGTRLMAVGTVLCGVAIVAATAVFVAIRKDQARKRKALGTPTDEYTDDDCSIATPMTHRLYGGYRHNGRYGNNGSSDNTPLASIVVIGPDDDFQTPAAYTSSHQYRSYSRKLSDSYASTESVKASTDSARLNTSHQNKARAVPAERQFDASHGPPVSELPSPTLDPIFDTNNTQVSFSSSMSSEYKSTPSPSERVYESEGSLTDSFGMGSSTHSVESTRDSDVSTEPRKRETSLLKEEEGKNSNTIASFPSSLSSLNSEYDIRDTEASEHIHPSELGTTSSRVALSFDMGSVSPRD